MPPLRRAVLNAVLAVFVLACGSSDTGPSYSNQLTAEYGAALATTIAGIPVEAVAGEISNVWHVTRVDTILARMFDPASCAPTKTGSLSSPGTPADADNDGIPDSAVYTYHCPYADTAGSRGVIGVARVRDLSLWYYGMGLTGDITITTGSACDTQVTHLTFSDTIEVPVFQTEGDVYRQVRTEVRSYDCGENETQTYAVNDTAVFITAPGSGLQILDSTTNGTLALYGTAAWTYSDRPAENVKLTLSTPTPLSYSILCTGSSQPFKGGTLKGSLVGAPSAGVSLAYSACNSGPTVAVTPTGTN